MAEEKQRELCPNLTSTKDLVDRIGGLSVDVLNKEKVLLYLWENIDELTVNVSSLTEEVQALNNIKDDNEKTLSIQGERIQSLESEKQSIEKSLRDDITDIKQRKNDRIHELEKTLKTIEAEAVINQEEVRKELMVTRNELSTLKESIKSKPKRAKKKTTTKPARA
jgi:chromosome segregation ATPase|tara:strand:- start:1406 stop:1903 length:498 start_codon:yes stop_codon:yes gene_type:complete